MVGKMVFAEDYFQGEEREGFYVQPLMKRTWAAQLEILEEIDRICKKHEIKYFAYYGTLLGAVRHYGFIPWDDDLDLGMLRGDYERFRHYAEKELPEGWFLLGTQPTVLRVMNTDRIRVDQEFLDRFHGCPYMMGVDIFCWDSVLEDEKEQKAVTNLFWSIAYLAVYWDEFEEGDRQAWTEAREAGVRAVEKMTGCHFDWNRPLKEQLAYLADQVMAMYWKEDCREVTRTFLLHERPDYRIQRRCVGEMTEAPYENMVIPVPKEYDPLLRLDYGDGYMTPVRDYAHSYPFFKDQIEALRMQYENRGETMPAYFEWEEL